MIGTLNAPSVEPFFLGERFCLYRFPNSVPCRGAVLYVHPFAEEMNKARRMATLQALAFARAGLAVLAIDLYGCGDSAGDFADARWEIWKHDLAAAAAWLRARGHTSIKLWGLRLGAALAIEFAADFRQRFAGFVLWQPVLNGELFLTQFLRLRTAADMISKNAKTGVTELKRALYAGEALEIAGYELSPELARALDRIDLSKTRPNAPVDWFEITTVPRLHLPRSGLLIFGVATESI
jgi:exosortase A-associated hydrolase 2